MKQIPLSKGLFAIVDDSDYDWLSRWKWYAHHGYAYRNAGLRPLRKSVPMHAAIMQTPKGFDTDHINGDTLDNRRSNLRSCPHSENVLNQKRRVTNTSGYKGVTWHKQSQKWRAQIQARGHKKSLGYFDTPEAASAAYETAARELYGDFYRPNP